MCRKSPICFLLGEDPAAWSKVAPLPPPDWFDDQLLIFNAAAERAANGERDTAIDIIRTMRSDEMRHWFVEHGQMSGIHRAKKFEISITPVEPEKLDVVRVAKPYESVVFKRDFYTCRYCGLRQIAKEVLVAFERAVGASEFKTQGTNALQHGVIHAFKIVADHVLPHAFGGRTTLDNLVSACPGCNYGKWNYTIEQLGLDDPFSRPPLLTNWDGLTSLLSRLKNNCL